MTSRIITTLIFLNFLTSLLFSSINFNGTGASFPFKFYDAIFSDYQDKKNITVTYTPNNSRHGFMALKSQSVDFSGVDLFVNDSLIKTLPEPKQLLHIPTCLGGIGIAFNIDGLNALNLSSKVLSKIILQEITNWSDPAIQGLNPDVSLPDLEIVVITRQGGSGSTFILTQYLSDMHDAWGAQIGTNSSLDLLNTLQAKTTTHMGKLISQIPGSIGYLAYNYGADFSLKFAAIENKSGNFITPNTASVSESANTEIPADARVFCTGTMSKNGYPLSSFSWLILYQEQSYNNRTKKEAKALKKFLKYIVKNGNNYADSLGYAPVPDAAKNVSLSILNTMTFKGRSL